MKKPHSLLLIFFTAGLVLIAILFVSITDNAFAEEEQDRSLSSDKEKYSVEFQFIGNTVFSDEELQELAAPYKADISFARLEELRNFISKHYAEHGYINSGAAAFSEQRGDQDIIIYKIIEGKLSDIEIYGNNRLRTGYIEKRIAKGIAAPLNIYDLEENVRLLHQDALIKRINADLKPGHQPGESILIANIVEETPYQFEVVFANDRAPSVGSHRGRIHAMHGNITGWGDKIDAWYGITEGMDDISFEYSMPFSASGSTIGAQYERSDASVVEEPFDQIDIESESETWGLSLSHPFYKKPDQELSFSLLFEHRRNETSLMGYPYSFSRGYQDGEAEISVFRFVQEYILQKRNYAFGFRSTMSWGVDAFGPTTQNPEDPDGDFFAWLGQFQLAKDIKWISDSQLILRANAQWAPDPLLAMEKMTLGGMNSVRGYRENQMVRDNGIVGSIEFRVPILRLPIPLITKSPEQGTVKMALFYDWGWGENSDFDTPDPRTISSEGIGLLWDPSDKIHARVYWGIRNRNVDNPRNDLQDNGIHFLVNCNIF